MKTANIFDLTARDRSWRSSHWELLILAFKAIGKNELRAHCADSLAQLLKSRSDLTLQRLVGQAISALEHNPLFFVQWFRLLLIDVDDYRHWRTETTNETAPLEGQESRRASLKDILLMVRRYVESERKAGRSASQKRAWRQAKVEMPTASHRQVVDALRKVERITKMRGRPRSASGH
jgi:hypothetical protein